ncbi:septum formation initiator family protein [Candidatus Chloroploca sp. Khr17]|uniref:FtsB family cell division protein n=1 Tax=Candidatus Chloroploca sp. Khr17 TaxID=2496869 RepID=UPI0013EC7B6F|nr:septum formation initiator family protein [Candidatus Chloroploca sp. Khr17]
MKRRLQHARRRLFGRPHVRRQTTGLRLRTDSMLGMLHLSGKSALTVGLALVMMTFIALLIVNFVGQVMQSGRLEAQRIDSEAELQRIYAENARLEGAVAFTESDVYVERAARDHLSYAYPEDTVILPRLVTPVPADNSASEAPEPSVLLETVRRENWRLWWAAFFPAES